MRSTGRFLARSFATSARKDHVKILADHWSPAVPRSPKGNNIVVETASGVWVTDITGRKYLDMMTGIGVTSTGHCHPRVVAAIQQQAAKGIHLQQNSCISQPVVELIERLCKVSPKGLDRFFFACTGTEAIESAVKLARHETGQQNVIYFKGGFHGRSLAALAMTTSKVNYRVGFGPLPSGFHQALYPYALRMGPGDDAVLPEVAAEMSLDSIKQLLKETTAPSETAAIIIEPILGEGGYVVPPKGFFTGLRKLCDEHGILLIADEVQSGCGRTGRMWATEHEGITPDIMCFAKGIASGMPLSGIAARSSMMLKSPPSSMGGTYGANAVSAAAACATIDVITQEGLLDNATQRGQQLMGGLRRLADKHPGHVAEVRGRGCMVGLEFAYPAGSGFAGAVTAACMEHGLLLMTTGWRETIRFIPALVVSQPEMDDVLARFGKGLEDAIKAWKGPKPTPHRLWTVSRAN